MRRVVLESPYAGDLELNVAYLKKALRHALSVGDAPIASHRMFPGILDDDDKPQRALGMLAGHAWIEVAEAMVVYADLGVSPGMRGAIEIAERHGVKVEYRRILNQGG